MSNREDINDGKKNASSRPATDDSVIEEVNKILQEGTVRGASDIHLEPTEDGLAVRLRIDGMLYPHHTFAREMMPMIISRLKIMAGMDIAEKRLPQDGNIYLSENNRKINIRVSILPVIYGEKMVLRILDPAGLIMPLNSLGFNEENLLNYLSILKQACGGMVLVTGPTAPGTKLRHINIV